MEPLAFRMRPTCLNEVIGQKHLIGENKILTNLINNKQLYPVSKNYPDITRFEVQEIAIKGEKVDLVCPGYCRITLRKLNGTKIQVHVPKNVKLDLVEPLI